MVRVENSATLPYIYYVKFMLNKQAKESLVDLFDYLCQNKQNQDYERY